MNQTTTDLQTIVQRALMDDSRTKDHAVAREVDGVVSVINDTDVIDNN